MKSKFAEARAAARVQLKIFFDAHPLAVGVVAIACVGDFFSWVSCERGMVSPPSKYLDSTFEPSTGARSRSTLSGTMSSGEGNLSVQSAAGSVRGGRFAFISSL